MKYENIITLCTQTTEHITDLTAENALEIYLPYITINLYGIPSVWDDEKKDQAIGDVTKAVPIGDISGYFVLGEAIYNNGGDILDYCDSVSALIENPVSALIEMSGPLCEDSNLFHIIEFNISDSVDEDDIENLLSELPDILFTHIHVLPDIISVYPEPLPHEESKLEKVQDDIARIAHYEVMKRVFDNYTNEIDTEQEANAPQLQLSTEQYNRVLGKRNIGDSYPEEYIDRNSWKPFISSGFEEWRNTRVLYKELL